MSNLEQRQTEFAKTFGLSLESYKKLASALSYTELITCLELLKARKHKSRFRESCRTKIDLWLVSPDYLKPLSPHQFKMAEPKWPIHYSIPN